MIGGESEDKDCDEDTTLNTRFRYIARLPVGRADSAVKTTTDSLTCRKWTQETSGFIHTSWTLKVSG